MFACMQIPVINPLLSYNSRREKKPKLLSGEKAKKPEPTTSCTHGCAEHSNGHKYWRGQIVVYAVADAKVR